MTVSSNCWAELDRGQGRSEVDFDKPVRAAVMQPTYLPWCGYFAMIDQVDTFVLLDDVQLSRPSWQTRNRILGPSGEPVWLSMDVARTASTGGVRIVDAVLDDRHGWRRKHLRQVALRYARAPHIDAVMTVLEVGLLGTAGTVGELNSTIIKAVCDFCELTTPIVRSSSLGITGSREGRLVEICRSCEASEYVSPPGSADYLANDNAIRQFNLAGVRITYQAHQCTRYPQGNVSSFVPQLSIVDHLAWLGPLGFRSHIRNETQGPIV